MSRKIGYNAVFNAAVYVQAVSKAPFEFNVFYRKVVYSSDLARKPRGRAENDVFDSKVFYSAEQKAGRNSVHTVVFVVTTACTVSEPFGIFLAPDAAFYRYIAVARRVTSDFPLRPVDYACVAKQQRLTALYEYDFGVFMSGNHRVRSDHKRTVDIIFAGRNVNFRVLRDCFFKRFRTDFALLIRRKIIADKFGYIDFFFLRVCYHITGSPFS